MSGDFEGARADQDQAIALDPKDAWAWRERASLRGKLGDPAGEQEDATHAIALEPTNGVAWRLRGWARAALGDSEGGLADVRRATELSPGDGGAWELRAALEGRSHARAEYLTELTNAVEREPGNAEGWRARGWARAESGDFAGAVADASRAVELKNDDTSALRLRGWAREEAGDLAGARADRERAHALDPTSLAISRPERPSRESIAAARAAWTASAKKNHGEALLIAQRALENGTTAAIASAVADCFRLGQVDVARDQLLRHGRVLECTEATKLGLVTVRCRFRQVAWSGELELDVTRCRGVEGSLAIAFTPGSWADGPDGPWTDPRGESRPKAWSKPQDLALLRAPVVTLGAGQATAVVRVPIACANFAQTQPVEGMPYEMRQVKHGAPTERLLEVVCAGDRPQATAAHLALWIVRGNLSWRHFVAGTEGETTAYSGEALGVDRVGETELLLERAAVKTEGTSFFDEVGAPAAAPLKDAGAP
jgi:tetratricopeptide (TPR) repeat protein